MKNFPSSSYNTNVRGPPRLECLAEELVGKGWATLKVDSSPRDFSNVGRRLFLILGPLLGAGSYEAARVTALSRAGADPTADDSQGLQTIKPIKSEFSRRICIGG
ncbi:hypothetical protein NW767_010254 [Fusarium falciforme]|nr:hypothetical protein NW767_010254 [Fusarium falciforme]KAJ4247964.1 hypothetical protein NW757_008587 [Fusarium falciforme]